MKLPGHTLAFGTRLDTIPSQTCYLPRPAAERALAWDARLGPHKKLRVGLVWVFVVLLIFAGRGNISQPGPARPFSCEKGPAPAKEMGEGHFLASNILLGPVFHQEQS